MSVQSRAARSAIVGERRRERGRHRRDAGRVLHARAPLALAVVAARIRGDTHAAPDVERADARRAAELVRRQREQVDVERLDVDREPPDRLARVGVEPDAGLAREAGGLGRPAASCRARGSRAGRSRAACRARGPRRRTGPGRCVRRRRPAPSRPRTRRSRGRCTRPPTAGCSTAPITTRVPSSRIARTPPQIASATDSVPPDVNTISSGCAPIARATTSRASSSDPTRRAARPVDRERVAERVERRDHRLARRGQERGGRRRVEVEVRGSWASQATARVGGRCGSGGRRLLVPQEQVPVRDAGDDRRPRSDRRSRPTSSS